VIRLNPLGHRARRLVARFARGEYLSLHLIIGFLASVIALFLFGMITDDVVHNEPITAIDHALAAWMRSHATPLGDQIAIAISFIGGASAMTPIAIIGAFVFAYRRAWIMLSGWIAAFAGGGVLDWLLKQIIRRPRPAGADLFIHDASFSFPSGHAMGSLIGFAMLAYALITFWPPAHRHRSLVVVAAVILVLLVGSSRIYLGVHYLSDVVAGFAAGIVWTTACVTGIEVASGRKHPLIEITE